MAVDKEAIICLSRVYSYYFKCNFLLFYVQPALKGHCIELKYYADCIHSGLTPPG